MFDGAALAAIAPGAAPFFALPLLDVPTFPQNTADFCSAPPPSDLATAADFALLATGVIGIATGAYRRVGNLVKANKWSELCQFKAAPVLHAPGTFCNPDASNHRWVWKLGVLPAGWQSATVTLHNVTPVPELWPQDDYVPRAYRMQFDVPDSNDPNQQNTLIENVYLDVLNQPLPFDLSQGGNAADQYIYVTLPFPTVEGMCMTASFSYVPAGAAPTELPPPDPVDTPDDYPALGPCDAPTLSDLCKMLAALELRTRWIADQLVPPELTPGDEAEPAEVDPVDGGTVPVDKPADAVGVIITATVIPNFVARYGHAPQFYPALGHCAMRTLAGPLPSVLIKHSPMVLTPLPPQVKQLQLDLAEGVSATFTWLYNPK